MGGPNSGRRREGKAYVGCTPALHVSNLRKVGALNSGFDGVLSWPVVGDVAARMIGRALSLAWDLDGQTVTHLVPLSSSPCNYGGVRIWLICPSCGARGTALHLTTDKKHIACRHCCGMTYQTKGADIVGRGHIKRRKLFRRLGHVGPVYRYDDVPRRPRGMHAETYGRIVTAIRAAEDRIDRAFTESVGPLLYRLLMRSAGG
ncbi:hypothetical protein J2D73_19345 [Acetobacter sacchari]|uniref:Transposase n=1 Tax=Acetobacter sacchari TaxID=2661687 RepID=A0ABS3M177_9PROT|nr:hypothetical protein [Acetobacter sacchari]MBO1361942.1 hypothetical protein [Acetobacter sacchari]